VRGAVSSGHPLTTGAAIYALEKGGNAFDAVIAAAFAATVTEPCLTSLGGGGFLLAHDAKKGSSAVYDFFVDSPGKGGRGGLEPHFEPIEVAFTDSRQVFHAGCGSVAVPGMLRGLMECYDDLCTLSIEDILAPALRCLEEGVEPGELQQYLSRILMPILTLTDYGRSVYEGTDRGRRLFNPLYREFLVKRDPGAWLDAFYGGGADDFARRMHEGCGLVTALDLRQYKVHKREPLVFGYQGREILTNGPPSFGGELLSIAFGALGSEGCQGLSGPDRAIELAGAMKAMMDRRLVAGGTTHISVIDGNGNAASLTSSNGSNSGCYLDGTGVMLNNMMGEDDLHPGGFHSMEPGLRVGSMMSPTIIRRGGHVESVLGSGGSKRIRTAMLQVIYNMLDAGLGVREAVEAPRMHLDDDGLLHLEPGFDAGVVKALASMYPLHQWALRDLYFGGVHVVTSGLGGWGDTRRGGAFREASDQ